MAAEIGIDMVADQRLPESPSGATQIPDRVMAEYEDMLEAATCPEDLIQPRLIDPRPVIFPIRQDADEPAVAVIEIVAALVLLPGGPLAGILGNISRQAPARPAPPLSS